MNRIFHQTAIVTSLLLALGQAAHGGPPNPTQSDAMGNTAGGTGALLLNPVFTTLPYLPVSNTAFGSGALKNNAANNPNIPAIANTAIGASALYSNVVGLNNTAIGASALYSNTAGLNNTASGASALKSNTTGTSNTANGVGALQSNTTGKENTAVGAVALDANTTGNQNTASGSEALKSNTTGDNNTANGYGALYKNTTGRENTAVGAVALDANTTGNYNVAIGTSALGDNTTGSRNTASGLAALGDNTTGNYNTASGYGALYSNTTGAGNAASGYAALYKNTTGAYNTANGYTALYSNTLGHYNTALGRDALKNLAGSSTKNLALGFQAGLNLTSGNNNIYLGHPGVATESNTLRLGNVQTKTFVAGVYGASVAGVPVYVTSAGQLGKQSSSARFKQDIAPLGQSSEPLYQLRPVSFHYKQDPQGQLQYGLIAEEVAEVYPALVTRDPDGQIDGVRYDALIPLLLNELQHQHQQIAELKSQNANLQAELKAQKESLWAAVEQLRGQVAEQRVTQVMIAATPRKVVFDGLGAR